MDGAGKFLPLMMIVKRKVSSKESADQTDMRVLDNLTRDVLTAAKGWTMCKWRDTLTLPNNDNQMVTAEHKVKYLRHIESGHTVTSQHKAWNDTVRMCMWVDLILKPAKDNLGGRPFCG